MGIIFGKGTRPADDSSYGGVERTPPLQLGSKPGMARPHAAAARRGGRLGAGCCCCARWWPVGRGCSQATCLPRAATCCSASSSRRPTSARPRGGPCAPRVFRATSAPANQAIHPARPCCIEGRWTECLVPSTRQQLREQAREASELALYAHRGQRA